LNKKEKELYDYIAKFCSENYKVKKCKYFDDKIYCLLPSDDIEKSLNISSSQQLALLKNLKKTKMVELKFEANKEVYFLIC